MSSPQMYSFIFEGKPQPKQRPRFTRTGHSYTPEQTRKAEINIASAAKELMGDNRKLSGPLGIEAYFLFPVPKSWSEKRKSLAYTQRLLPTSQRTGDIDNLIKTVTDALNKIVYDDDSQIISVCATKVYTQPGSEKTVIDIGEIDTLEDIPPPAKEQLQ